MANAIRKDGVELAELGRRVTSSLQDHLSSSFSTASDAENDDEVELQWAAIERLPTFKRIRTSLFDDKLINDGKGEEANRVIDVTKLGSSEHRVFIDKLITIIEADNLRLVGLELPTVEVRFKNLSVEAECEVVHRESLPNLWNTIRNTSSDDPVAWPSRLRKNYFVKGTCREARPISRDILKEVSRREKLRGIIPEPDIDTYMKAISVEGLKRTLQTDYILKILGLDNCADTIVGDAMKRGISGGEKRRLTTGIKCDQPNFHSTTFQIATCLQQLTHITGATILISLLQPAPETFDLFDDIILMAEGKTVYHGPRSNIREFFEHCGFRCPQRKGLADFLQQVLSEKDQAQYWYHMDRPQSYVSTDQFFFEKVSTDQFIAAFKEFHAGQKLNEELCTPFNKVENHKNALSFSIYSLGKWELFKACLAREWLLMKRNSIFYVFKSVQVSSSNETLGHQVLRSRGLNFGEYFYWISVGALIGMWILINVGFTLALSYLKRKFYSTPGVLTALMGASGAGKTTLMDVLSGRKTGGHIEGDIRIGEYPKVQEAYARISGYCEQTDIHSPQITVGESVMYSAWLRLPAEFDKHKRLEFVAEVLQMIELDEIKDALVGVTGVSGILSEQRKRLTIAVEVVSNPSIIFMDEPTSGLDARAAAIVMRVVKNISSTRRTIVCTIHQPSIDIFEAFDEVILMKRGGHIIYSGELGLHSSKLVEYFEGIPGVPKIKENYNPATWMLEITNPSAEARLGVDFAHLYKESHLYQYVHHDKSESTVKILKRNKELVKELSIPVEGSKELRFSTRFPQNGWEQFKACLWKQHLSYWRNPAYNLGRLMFTTVSSFLYGALLWQKGQKIDNEQDLFNIMGSMYVFMMSTGVIIEIPYIFIEAALFLIITYPAVNLYGSAYKVFWYFYAIFCTMLNYKYLGMVIVSLTPTYQAASICASYSVTVLNLFSGFLIPGPQLPKWWVWCYWIAPSSWTLRGLLTSQYGDIKQEIIAFGERKTISAFLEGRYGFKHHDLSITAILLIAYPLFSASVFTYFMAKLNFQKR
ncbi:ABC transporter-like [Theobroma cacao]|nr:ABC transporter-like [Theobroma cacao]